MAAADYPYLLFLPHLLQFRRDLVRRQCEPLLCAECAAADRHGLHGGEAAVLAAYDTRVVLRDRRGA